LWLPSQNTSWEPQVVAPISEYKLGAAGCGSHLRMPVSELQVVAPSQNASW
jgi:hypothetical protein